MRRDASMAESQGVLAFRAARDRQGRAPIARRDLRRSDPRGQRRTALIGTLDDDLRGALRCWRTDTKPAV